MITNTHAIVLWSRRSREADKIFSVYTAECGRLTVRAISAAKSTAKFAALTEPFVCSELAIHRSGRHHWGKLVGGHLTQSFPGIRTHLEKATAASWLCEVVARLTPEEDPQFELFFLLKESLTVLEEANEWRPLRLAFAVRFLHWFGLGLERQPTWQQFQSEHPEQADQLKSQPLAEMERWGLTETLTAPLERLIGELFAQQLSHPLQVNRFRQLAGVEI